MSLGTYYDKIIKEPLLTKEEEADLFLEYQDEGSPEPRKAEIRDKIIRANLRFVFKQAKHFSKSDPSMFEELIASGNEGLLVGMNKFKPESGHRFLTYAGWWVNQKILERMGNQRIVSLPTWKQQLASRIQKVIEANEITAFETLREYFQEHYPDTSEKVLFEMYQTRYLTFYIEDLDDNAFEIDPIQEAEDRQDKEKLYTAVINLPAPINKVIAMSFGLVDGDEKKAQEIAKELGLRKDQVRDLKAEGLRLLQSHFQGVNPFE